MSNEIREFRESDLPAILRICRECFPASLRWRNPNLLGRVWWQLRICRPNIYVLVCTCEEKVAAFCLMVVPTSGDRCLPAASSLMKTMAILKSCFFNPDVFFRRAFLFILGKLCYNRDVISINMAKTIATDEKMWIELVAVSKQHQGKGLAGLMFEVCEQKARENGLKYIQLRADAWNRRAISLYEKLGFTRAGQTAGGYLYIKLLSDDDVKSSPQIH